MMRRWAIALAGAVLALTLFSAAASANRRGDKRPNLDQLYRLLPALASEPLTTSTLERMHGVAMRGLTAVDASGLGADAAALLQREGIGQIRKAWPALKGLYSCYGCPELSVARGSKVSRVVVYSPLPEQLPGLLDKFCRKYEELLGEARTKQDVLKVAAWAGHVVGVAHPFYDAAGRVARAVYCQTFMRKGLPANSLELKAARGGSPHYELLYGFVFRLYAQQTKAELIDLLPKSAAKRLRASTGAQLEGFDVFSDSGSGRVMRDRARSLGRVLDQHLDRVTLKSIDTLFSRPDLRRMRRTRGGFL